MNLFNEPVDKVEAPCFTGVRNVKDSLKDYIKIAGLVPFKDYYLKVKSSQLNNIPGGITKDQFLQMAKDVYEARAAQLGS